MSSMSAISPNRDAISSFFISSRDDGCSALYFVGVIVRIVIWTGTCGFGRRQADVLRQLDAVEIQETFYRPVSVERAVKWRAAAAQPFRLCWKESPWITNKATSHTSMRTGRISHD